MSCFTNETRSIQPGERVKQPCLILLQRITTQEYERVVNLLFFLPLKM